MGGGALLFTGSTSLHPSPRRDGPRLRQGWSRYSMPCYSRSQCPFIGNWWCSLLLHSLRSLLAASRSSDHFGSRAFLELAHRPEGVLRDEVSLAIPLWVPHVLRLPAVLALDPSDERDLGCVHDC